LFDERRREDLKERSHRTVLCIGDDLLNLNLRCSLLKKQGWRVISSGSGHDGLFRFAEGGIDAVVLDLDDDGSENALIASQIRKQQPGIPILMLIRDQSRVASGVSEQADALILKEDEEQLLPALLKQLFEKSWPS